MVLPGDNPIKRLADDDLNRSDAAMDFAEEILLFDRSEGLVVGVLGPWGSGKTSFVNMTLERLQAKGVALLQFNPWMFSGAEQLVDSFFIELSAQLKMQPGLGDVGQAIEEYGEAFAGLGWLPFVGAWLERVRLIGKATGKLMQRHKEGAASKRRKVYAALNGEGVPPILVTLDDIDRLTTAEIREVFKLVRLTASFPNVIYLLAFDRLRVEAALSEVNIPGRDYMEKILQLAIDLPVVAPETLRQRTLSALDEVLASVDFKDEDDSNRWLDIYFEIVAPLIRNLRDVRRYAASVRGPASALAGHLSLSDILALEAIRTFLPDVFTLLQRCSKELTQTKSAWPASTQAGGGGEIESILVAAGDRQDVADNVVRRLFPAAAVHLPVEGPAYGHEWKATWLKAGRVAHEDNLRLYLERVASSSLNAFRVAQKVFDNLDNLKVAQSFLVNLTDDELGAVAEASSNFAYDLSEEQAVPVSALFLNMVHKLGNRRTGIFDIPQELVVLRTVKKCIEAVPEASRLAAVRSILSQVHTLFGQLQLIELVGYKKNVGLGLVPEADAESLEKEWRQRVRDASLADLVNDGDALRVVRAAMATEPSEAAWAPPEQPIYTLKIFRSSVSLVRGQTVGNRKVTTNAHLHWDAMVEIFGSEVVIKDRLAEVKDVLTQDDEGLIDLVEKYLSGWRPKED